MGKPIVMEYTAYLEALLSLVREERERRGISYRAWESESGVSFNVLFRIMENSIDPRLSTVIKLAKWLDFSMNREEPANV